MRARPASSGGILVVLGLIVSSAGVLAPPLEAQRWPLILAGVALVGISQSLRRSP